jgi:hypothetical protein
MEVNDSVKDEYTVAEAEVLAVVNRETQAWNSQDVELLLSVFHPHMCWAWPPDNDAHDPEKWVFALGHFDKERWGRWWQSRFDDFEVVHNQRNVVRILMSEQLDAGLAIVDIDTRWKHRQTGEMMLWQGRTGKMYSKNDGEWKMINQTGVLTY